MKNNLLTLQVFLCRAPGAPKNTRHVREADDSSLILVTV